MTSTPSPPPAESRASPLDDDRRASPPPAVVLVSACLLGVPCRYDGRAATLADGDLADAHPILADAGTVLVPVCPEQLGGLPTPRPAASIEPGATGDDVLVGRARVLQNDDGRDVSAHFIAGANAAVAIAKRIGATHAVLKERSPSCGTRSLRRADGALDAGQGVTAAALTKAGIEVDGAD